MWGLASQVRVGEQCRVNWGVSSGFFFMGFLLRRMSREMSGTKFDIIDGFRQREVRGRF